MTFQKMVAPIFAADDARIDGFGVACWGLGANTD